MSKNKSLAEKREQARSALYNLSLTRSGAKEIADYFIGTVPWSRLIQAYEEMKYNGKI